MTHVCHVAGSITNTGLTLGLTPKVPIEEVAGAVKDRTSGRAAAYGHSLQEKGDGRQLKILAV